MLSRALGKWVHETDAVLTLVDERRTQIAPGNKSCAGTQKRQGPECVAHWAVRDVPFE